MENVYEWCDNCGQETKISNKGGKCKCCNKFLLPCSLCDMDKVKCNNCKIKGV